jgi:hypothetical protein
MPEGYPFTSQSVFPTCYIQLFTPAAVCPTEVYAESHIKVMPSSPSRNFRLFTCDGRFYLNGFLLYLQSNGYQ